MIRKSQFVRHPDDSTHALWGVGIALASEKLDKVRVFFENTATVKTIGTNFVKLVVVKDPGQSRLFLKNALYVESSDTLPFSQVVEKFLERFEGGLQGELYLSNEREYKALAHKQAAELLGKDAFSELLGQGDFKELAARIKKVYTKSNLLASAETIKLNDALKTPEGAKKCAEVFFELLYGESEISKRIEAAASEFEDLELAKWPIVTYLPFVMFPEDCMFIKPTTTKEAANRRGYDIQYDIKVNSNTYQRVLEFSLDLKERLLSDPRTELHPKDMFDVQGFMWCTFGGSWTDQDVESAKLKLKS